VKDSLKVSDFREVKVKNNRLILALYRQSHVTALIAQALTKVIKMLADLKVGIHGAGLAQLFGTYRRHFIISD
jgi:hypothetical protein